MSIVMDIAPDAATMASRAAAYMVDAFAAETEALSVCLAGGETPRAVYGALASDPLRDRVPWGRIHWFVGDERFVPPDDPRSNIGMIRATLLSNAPVPEANIHAMPTTGLTIDDAASAYEMTLRAHYGADALDQGRALFDVVLLGLGPDGHTASLLPGTAALEERRRWVVPVSSASQPEPRLTLTCPVLEASRRVVFLATGAAKRAALARLRDGDPAIPAGRLRPAGVVHAFVDAAAAG